MSWAPWVGFYGSDPAWIAFAINCVGGGVIGLTVMFVVRRVAAWITAPSADRPPPGDSMALLREKLVAIGIVSAGGKISDEQLIDILVAMLEVGVVAPADVEMVKLRMFREGE